MATCIEKKSDYQVLLENPQPFEMDLPWSDDAFSERFYKIVNDWGIPTEREIKFLNGYLPEKAKILDLACGGGRHSVGLAQLGHALTGIEIGAYPIKVAQKAAYARDLKINFIQSNILECDYPGQNDMVFLICGQLGHFPPAASQLIFRKTEKALKSGGLFVVHLPTFTPDEKLNLTSWYTEKEPFYFRHPSFVHREQFYIESARTKIIRDFAVDTITRENRLFGISEKSYTQTELADYAQTAKLKLIESYGDYEKKPITAPSRENIYIFIKK